MGKPLVPRFRLFPVLLWGLLTFWVMTSFFDLFFTTADLLKDEARHLGHGHLTGPGWPLGVLLATLAVLVTAAVRWHGPLVRTFRALGSGREPAPGDLARARKRIYWSPVVIGLGIPALLGAVSLALVLGNLPAAGVDTADLPPEIRALPVNLLFLVLSGIFIYLFQHHRIQTRYLVHLFSTEEMASNLPPIRDHSIGKTLALLTILAAVLPVAMVLTLLATGITRVADPGSLSPAEWTLLLGSSNLGIQAQAIRTSLGLHEVPILLVNTLDTWRIAVGSVLGVALMLGYVFFVFRWVAGDLTAPLYSLRNAMKRVEEGHPVPAQPVVTSNEIGDLTLGFNQMMKVLGERDRIKGLFGQYLTREVSEAILDGRVNLGGDKYEVTVLFTDIRDFTALSDQMPPEEVFGFLNGYLDAMIEVLVAQGGFIDKFLGDGILTVFGLPVRTSGHALAAFEAARAMGGKLADLNKARAAAGLVPIAIGSGLHTGEVIAGNVGSVRKLQFTVIGDTVNLASRLEGMNKRYGSVMTLSEVTWSRLPPDLRETLPFVKEEGVEIRGKKDPVTLYRLD